MASNFNFRKINDPKTRDSMKVFLLAGQKRLADPDIQEPAEKAANVDLYSDALDISPGRDILSMCMAETEIAYPNPPFAELEDGELPSDGELLSDREDGELGVEPNTGNELESEEPSNLETQYVVVDDASFDVSASMPSLSPVKSITSSGSESSDSETEAGSESQTLQNNDTSTQAENEAQNSGQQEANPSPPTGEKPPSPISNLPGSRKSRSRTPRSSKSSTGSRTPTPHSSKRASSSSSSSSCSRTSCSARSRSKSPKRRRTKPSGSGLKVRGADTQIHYGAMYATDGQFYTHNFDEKDDGVVTLVTRFRAYRKGEQLIPLEWVAGFTPNPNKRQRPFHMKNSRVEIEFNPKEKRMPVVFTIPKPEIPTPKRNGVPIVQEQAEESCDSDND